MENVHWELPSIEAATNAHLYPFGLKEKLPTGSPIYRTTFLPGYWTTINQDRTGYQERSFLTHQKEILKCILSQKVNMTESRYTQ